MRTTHGLVPAVLLASMSLAAPLAATAADEPRYTYGEVGYLNVDFDDFDLDGDGFGVGGSYALHKNVHLVADYQSVELDGTADFSAFTVGAGVNYPLRSGLDLVGRLRFVDAELDVPGGDDTGFGLEAGLRTMINSRLELNGSVRYVDVYDENTSLAVGALYDVVNNLAVGAEVEVSDDVTTFFLRGRYYFAPRWQLR